MSKKGSFFKMFINKTKNGKNNISGEQITKFRKEMRLSQRALASKLQIAGLNIDKNAIQRMESGQRFITDIELVYLSEVLKQPISNLLDKDEINL